LKCTLKIFFTIDARACKRIRKKAGFDIPGIYFFAGIPGNLEEKKCILNQFNSLCKGLSILLPAGITRT
jgi:hypothetical protein